MAASSALRAAEAPSPRAPADRVGRAFHVHDGPYDLEATEYGRADEPWRSLRLLVHVRRNGRTVIADDRSTMDDGFTLTVAPEVADVSAFEAPDVVVLGGNGGNDCCGIARVYVWDSHSSSYGFVEKVFILAAPHSWPYLERDERNAPNVFVSTGRANCHDSMADCDAPIRVWAVRKRRFVDVTLEHPNLIVKDMMFMRRLMDHPQRHAAQRYQNPALAYAADAAMLGSYSEAVSWLVHRGAVHRGEVAALRAEVACMGYLPGAAHCSAP